ncbi:DNA repair helicase XPB [Gorillibacterium sp. CAU 1737]|uniref:DNA repair helicase XPB n=1 Tax=Gorillibacterium sp. CAU 1737 TaxID=3140362 RepID=UPI00326070C3
MDGPLIIKNDGSILLDTGHPQAGGIRKWLAVIADLVKNPGTVHLYRLTACSLWGAAAQGRTSEEVLDALERHSRTGVPPAVRSLVTREMGRYGLLRLIEKDGVLVLVSEDDRLVTKLLGRPELSFLVGARSVEGAVPVALEKRGAIKRELARLGYPVVDEAGFHEGETVEIRWRTDAEGGALLRDYQQEAVEAFALEGTRHGGSGVIVLPCGAGKTLVGIAAMARLGCATLILAPNVASVRQWKRELLARTFLSEEEIGEYSGEIKEVRPITIATYQILTHRVSRNAPFWHMELFRERDWGLIVYDEVHLLPAPVFRVTAEIQATRRLGLTATLLREDGCEEDVFSLIGPKRYELPWRELEAEGHLARLEAWEIRIPLGDSARKAYEAAQVRAQFRIAAENEVKLQVCKELLHKHEGLPTLIIGHYLAQLEQAARLTYSALITGKTPHEERERLYQEFRDGRRNRLVVSRVANFAIDLPEAQVAIELSGSYGSRQEETQRIGRVLRPKKNGGQAWFYTLVSDDTVEVGYARKRRLFLAGQGYHYRQYPYRQRVGNASEETEEESGNEHRIPANVQGP